MILPMFRRGSLASGFSMENVDSLPSFFRLFHCFALCGLWNRCSDLVILRYGVATSSYFRARMIGFPTAVGFLYNL